METAPILVPAPAIVEVPKRSKPVIIQPPEVSAAHDMAVIAFILTFLLSLPWLVLSLIIGGIGVAAYLGYAILPPVIPVSLQSVPFLGPLLVYIAFVLAPSFLMYIGLGGGALLIVLILLGIFYWTTVHAINVGRYQKARNASLIWGVLFILPTFFVLFAPTQIFGVVIAIIPAFFLLMAYGRLGEVVAKYGPVAVMGEAAPGMGFAGPSGPMGGVMPPMAAMPGPMPGMMSGPMASPIPGPMPAMMPSPISGAMPSMMPSAMPGPMPGIGSIPPNAVGPPTQPLTGVAPRVPICPGCGRELYYSANHRRWYCMTCDNPMGTGGRLPRP